MKLDMARVARYAKHLREGWTQAEIAAAERISGAAVSKFIKRHFELVPKKQPNTDSEE